MIVIIGYGIGEKRNRMKRKQEIPYEIRWIRPEEWEEVMKLIWNTFMKFEAKDYTQAGIHNFKAFINDPELYQSYLDGSYQMMVALNEDHIIGEISVRSGNHISLLFVDEAYHRKGVGRELMLRMGEYLKQEKREIYLTVKAAPYAVGFYRRIGFRISMPEEEVAGIRVTSMEKFL